LSRRIPTHLKILRGNPGHQKLEPAREPRPALAPEPPEAPDFLSPYAREEWRRVIGEAHRLRLVTALDVQIFGAYCDAYSRWRTAAETIAEMAERDPVMHGQIVKTQSGGAAANPLMWICSSAAKSMLSFANELGLTPVARSRIAAGPLPTPNKFQGYIRGLNDGGDRA
jgi:P27 family predicted phage terminase small subunit